MQDAHCLHQICYIKHHENYLYVDVDVTPHMIYVMYDVPNTGYLFGLQFD